MLAESLLILLEQHVTVAVLLLGHLLEQSGGSRIALGEILGETHVNAPVLLLGGDGERQNFAFGQFRKGFQAT